jgi:REP element-mobilizing transposase RayT
LYRSCILKVYSNSWSNLGISRRLTLGLPVFVHCDLATKCRHQVFGLSHFASHGSDYADVCADFGCELAEFNGEAEHVHLLVNFPPTVAISRLVNSFKGVSSR